MTAAITTNGAVYTHTVPDAAGTPAAVTASGTSSYICTAPDTSVTTAAVIIVAT